MANEHASTAGTVTLPTSDGVSVIEQGTPLTRLHYFDGKFLRADALTLEQDYHRAVVRQTNLAGGWGVVNGLGLRQSGDRLEVTAGLAITPAGSIVLAPRDFGAALSDLLRKAVEEAVTTADGAFAACVERAAPEPAESHGPAIFEVTVGPGERLCGNEAVYGKLCEDACVTDSQRPYLLEGVVLRLRPLSLALPTTQAVSIGAIHLRNRVASACFAAERARIASLVSGAGLAGSIWCNPAELNGRDEVAIGVMVREGGATRFIDTWSARRERMETQARAYWQGRLSMRPWNVFLAQILQFQCQLAAVFQPGRTDFEPLDDQCRDLHTLLGETLKALDTARRRYVAAQRELSKGLDRSGKKSFQELADKSGDPFGHLELVETRLTRAWDEYAAMPRNRMLLNAGFLDLPAAGYLTVQAGKQPINEQLVRMFGEGVELFFCTARPDYIPHALEEAQHMERISLWQGLDNPKAREAVEIFVPDGEIVDVTAADRGTWWTVSLQPEALVEVIRTQVLSNPYGTVQAAANKQASQSWLSGVGRTAAEEGGATSISLVCSLEPVAGSGWTILRPRLDHLEVADYAKYKPSAVEAEGDPGGKTAPKEAAGDATGDVAPESEEANGQIPWSRLYRASTAAGAAHLVSTPEIIALYGDLQISRDPFGEEEGASVPVQYELRLLSRLSEASGTGQTIAAHGLQGTGTLSIQRRETVDVGRVGLWCELGLHLSLSDDAGKDDSRRATLRVRIQRKGDASGGELDLRFPKSSSDVLGAEWKGTPRKAVFGPRIPDRSLKEQEDIVKVQTFDTRGASKGLRYAEVPRLEIAAAGLFRSGDIWPYVTLGEIPMPAPESSVRLTALNTLSALAQQMDDDGFLARARNRLFPEQPKQSTLQVRAKYDWVMFRRQRSARCSVDCGCPTPSRTEAFLVWHARVTNVRIAGALRSYLDGELQEAPKGVAFERVEVLHYLDDASTPEEFANRIVADWSKVRPGNQVVLGRVWEQSPITGQGWQNHDRLKRLIDLLGDLTQPPPVPGALRVLTRVPETLEDRRFDGGMVLVTQEVKKAERHRHVVYLATRKAYDALAGRLDADTDESAQALRTRLEELIKSGDVVEVVAEIENGVPTARSKQELTRKAGTARLEAVLLRSQSAPALATSRKECEAVYEVVGATPRGGGGKVETHSVALPSFDDEAALATLLIGLDNG